MLDIHYKKMFRHFTLDARFTVPAQGVTVLFGPSASGKSTLLNCMAGLEDAERGFFKFNESVLEDDQLRRKIPAHRRRIAYVFQDSRLFPHMNVADNLRYGYTRNTEGPRHIDYEEIIEQFSLKSLLPQYPHELSGGQKQRVALARALLSNPRLLILDEPVSALDYSAKQELLPYLEKLHSSLTFPVIYVSHDLKEVLQLGDYMLVIQDGKIIDQGDIVELCVSQPLMTQSEGASFILKGTVTHIDLDHCISTVNCDGNSILISGNVLDLQREVRILVHARDVSLSLTQASDSSILNILPVKVRTIHKARSGRHLVECSLDQTTVLAMISIRSVENLGLKAGSNVYAQFKATAMVR